MSVQGFREVITELCTDCTFRNKIAIGKTPLPVSKLTDKELNCLQALGEQAGHIPPSSGHAPQSVVRFREAITRLCIDEMYRNKVMSGTVSLKDDYNLTETQMVVLEEAGKCAGHIP